MLLKNLASLLVVCSLFFSIASCKTAPVLNWMVVDPSGFVNKYGTIVKFDQKESGEIACISADDIYRVVKACKQAVPLPAVLYCAWDIQSQLFGCGDETLRSIDETVNWSCLSARNWGRFIDYCHRRATRNLNNAQEAK